MKAWTASNEEGYGIVVFAETKGKAKAYLMNQDFFDGYDFTEIKVYRAKQFDAAYRGYTKMDWLDATDRIAMVKDGWYCIDVNRDDCEECPAKEYCGEYQDWLEDCKEGA